MGAVLSMALSHRGTLAGMTEGMVGKARRNERGKRKSVGGWGVDAGAGAGIGDGAGGVRVPGEHAVFRLPVCTANASGVRLLLLWMPGSAGMFLRPDGAGGAGGCVV